MDRRDESEEEKTCFDSNPLRSCDIIDIHYFSSLILTLIVSLIKLLYYFFLCVISFVCNFFNDHLLLGVPGILDLNYGLNSVR